MILREKIPPGAKVLSGRFVLDIKSTDEVKIKLNARYVIGCHCGRLKDMIVYSETTTQSHSIGILLNLSAAHGFYF